MLRKTKLRIECGVVRLVPLTAVHKITPFPFVTDNV